MSSGNENSSLSPKEKISHELERYLQTPQLDTDDNPLLWWKGNQQMFPVLALMVKKFLCTSASSSVLECTFSTSGIKTHGSESQGQEEAACMHVF